MGELLEMTKSELLALDKFGEKSVQEVEECLAERGYALSGTDDSSEEDMDSEGEVEDVEMEDEEDEDEDEVSEDTEDTEVVAEEASQ